MRDIIFSEYGSDIILRQESDRQIVAVDSKDLPELIEKCQAAYEKYRQKMDKIEGITIDERDSCVFLRQDFDEESVQIKKQDIAKLILQLQKIV